MKPLLKTIAWLFLLAFSLVVSGFGAYVFQRLFNWYVVPTLGVADIGFWRAFGLAQFVTLSLYGVTLTLATRLPNEDGYGLQKHYVQTVVFALMYAWSLLIGWLVHSFA